MADRASLGDMINYEAEEYFSPEEISLIQTAFKDKRVMRVLRKLLLPTISDPDLPLEQFGNDIFLSGRQYAQIPDAEVKSVILAREDAVKLIAGALIRLKVIVNSAPEAEETKTARLEKDSTQ